MREPLDLIHIADFKSIYKYQNSPDLSWWIEKKYWENMQILATESMFDVIGHADYIKLLNNQREFRDSKELIRDVLRLIRQNNKVIEFNTGSYWWLPISFPDSDILSTAIEFNIPIIITSDSHNKQNLANGFRSANKKLTKLVRNWPLKYRPCEPGNKVLQDLIFRVK